MKQLYILPVIMLLFSASVLAQTPQSIPYQAVARNTSGNLLVNQLVSLRFTVHDNTATGTTLYRETQTATTNKLGLFNVNVGAGTVVTGTFGAIAWGNGNAKYLQVEIDPAGGTSYTDMGASQMMSVPYALYAGSAGSSSGTAGGDLSGTYPAPQVAGIKGTPVTIAGLANNNILQYNGSSWTNVPPANAANGAFIVNQTVQQSNANFNISGSGVIGGTETVAGLTTLNGGLTETGNVNITTASSGSVAINNPSPNPSAVLDIASTTQGILPPRMTTAQRNLINVSNTSASQGLTIFNTSTNCLEAFIGTTWQPIGCGCTSPPAAPTAFLTFPTPVCQGYNNYVYSIPEIAGASTYNWTLPTGASIANGSGTSSITVNFAANSVIGSQPITVTASNSCGTSIPVLSQNVTVYDIPRITTQPASATICAQGGTGNTGNTSFSVVATGQSLSYQWQVNTGSGFTNISNGGVYSNATTSTLNISGASTAYNSFIYQCVVSGYCNPSVTTIPVTLTVNPLPVVSNLTLTTCSGAPFSITPVPSVTGTTYNWPVPAGSGFTNGASASGQNNVNGTLSNASTTTAVTATYTVTPVAPTGCLGTPFTVTVTVNPMPQVTLPVASATTTCPGATQATITPVTTNSGGTLVFSWANSTNNTGVGNPGTQTGATSIPLFTTTNAGTTQLIDVITVTPTVSMGGQNCTGTPVTFNYYVNPSPAITITAGQNQTWCVGNTTTVITTSTTATGGVMTYPWTNTTTGINLAASEANTPIAAFSATNSSNNILTGTITITPTYTANGRSCSGPSGTATINVNPVPNITITAGTPQTLCVGSSTADITTTTTTTGAGVVTFPWTNNNVGIGLGSSGTNTPVSSFVTTDGTGANITGTISITPLYTFNGVGCAGTPANAVITVDAASVAGTVTQNPGTGNHICQGSNVTYTLSGQTGTFNYFQYQWNTTGGPYSGSWNPGNGVGANPGIWNASLNGASILYVQAVVTNGVCPAAYSTPVNVTVDATSVAGTVAQSPATGSHVCVGSNVNYTLSGQTGNFNYFEYSWNSGTGPWSGAWGNTNPFNWTSGTNGASVLYVRANVSNGVCAAAVSSAVAVTVDAASVAGTLTQSPATDGHVCQGGNVGYTITGSTGTPYFQYAWNSPAPNSGSWGISGNGTTSGTWVSSLNPGTASQLYVDAVIQNGVCPAATTNVVNVTVDATSVAGSITQSPASGGTVCNGSNVTYTLAGQTGNFSQFLYQWNGSAGIPASYTNWYATNPAVWPSGQNGASVLYVIGQVSNGVCPAAYTSPVNVTVQSTTNNPGTISAPASFCANDASQVISSVTAATTGTPASALVDYNYYWYQAPYTGTGNGAWHSFNVTTATSVGIPAAVYQNAGTYVFQRNSNFVCTGESAGTPDVTVVVNAAVSAGGHTSSFAYTGSLQSFTVPCGITSITVTANGAQGGNGGGKGAKIVGTFAVNGGDIYNVIVGGAGGAFAGYNGGGGGGSFVYNAANNTLLVAAGGGGGTITTCNTEVGGAGSATTTPTAGAGAGSGAGGSGGGGGTGGGGSASYATGGAGGGWSTNGGNGTAGYAGLGGKATLNGAAGGAGGAGGLGVLGGAGGYGGGGSAMSQCGAGGGGGGYNGGGGGNSFNGSVWGAGGGGGSYNGGTSQSNTAGSNSGNGSVTITY